MNLEGRGWLGGVRVYDGVKVLGYYGTAGYGGGVVLWYGRSSSRRTKKNFRKL